MPSLINPRPEGGFLSPHGDAEPLRSIDPPGCKGPRAYLSFVLNILAGSDLGVIQQELLKAERMAQPNPDALRILMADPRPRSIAQRSMVSMMRELADQWIDSGKSGADRTIDTPSERNVQDIPTGYTSSLLQRIRIGYLNLHPHWDEMRRDGTRGIVDSPPRFDSEFLDGISFDQPLRNFGRETAYFWFLKLLDSPYSRHLARCDECRSYFAYERARKGTSKNGVVCSECKGVGSRKRTQTSRDRRKKGNIDAAADVWEKWKPNSSHGPRPKWIAAQVRERSHQTIIFTGSWVTRHQEEIETEINRRKNAKG